MGKFDQLYAINVNDKIEKKGSLNYLSWCYAWAEFKKVYPEATYTVNPFDGTFCSGNEKIGYMVFTSVTADGLTYSMWLPVMDARNKSILQPTSFDVNKAIMRCLTKNLAMFGLGLYIYAGEDLPESEKPGKPENGENGDETGSNSETPQNKPKNRAKLNDNAKAFQPLTMSELIGVWGVQEPIKTIAWFEQKFGVEIKDWDEELTEIARVKLKEQKAKREETERYKSELKSISEDELPFRQED